MALRAGAVSGNVVFLNQVTIAFDQQFMAVRAMCVLQVANSSREIACIIEPQSHSRPIEAARSKVAAGVSSGSVIL